MGTPQIVLIIIMTMGFAVHLAKHGDDLPTTTYHVGWKLADIIILILILWWGGFWK